MKKKPDTFYAFFCNFYITCYPTISLKHFFYVSLGDLKGVQVANKDPGVDSLRIHRTGLVANFAQVHHDDCANGLYKNWFNTLQGSNLTTLGLVNLKLFFSASAFFLCIYCTPFGAAASAVPLLEKAGFLFH